MGGVDFTGYGASVSGYPHDYLTAACAVGLSPAELDEFLLRLDKALRKAKGDKAGGAEREGRPGATELRGNDVAEEGVHTVAVAGNSLEKAEASGPGVGAAATARHRAEKNTPDVVVVAVTAAEHHAAQAVQDTPGVEQSRVTPDTTDSERFEGVSDSGVDGRAMPEVSEALGLEDDDDWDAVD